MSITHAHKMLPSLQSDLYAFTLKFNTSPDNISKADLRLKYDLILDLWESKGCKIIYVFPEDDSRGVLHLHGKVKIPLKVYRRSMVYHNCHLKLLPIFDEDGWLDYCTKSGQNIYYQRKKYDMNDEPAKSAFYQLFPPVQNA